MARNPTSRATSKRLSRRLNSTQSKMHTPSRKQAPHVDRVFDDGAAAADGEAAAGPSTGLRAGLPDRDDAEVGVRAQAGVEDDLPAAVVAPLGQGGEVQEAEVQGRFDLVDMVAGAEG